MSNLFVEATRYDDKATSENRLTQVFAASFNNSSIVRRVFLKTIGVGYVKECFIETQQQSAESSRPDMLLFLNNTKTEYCLIESKTESDVSADQLRRHVEYSKRNDSCKKLILITLHFANAPQNWISIHWNEVGEKINSELELLKQNSVDFFIAQSFIEFLKEYGYMKPSYITVSCFKNAAEFVNTIRQKMPHKSKVKDDCVSGEMSIVDGISDLARISDFFTVVLEMFFETCEFKGKHLNQTISHWFLSENKKEKNQTYAVTIGKKINMKGKRNKISGFGLHFQQRLEKTKDQICISIWKNTYFITLAYWSLRADKFIRYEKSGDRLIKKGECTELGAKEVFDTAARMWDEWKNKSAAEIGF